MSKAEWVKEQIKAEKVVVFSKTYCPYCKMAKTALSDAGLKEDDYWLFELDERTDGEELLDILRSITGARTVPRVFIGGEFIGGGSEMRDLQASGQLVPKLIAVGALRDPNADQH